MNKIIFLFFIFLANSTHAQEKMITSKGVINFEASVPYFEAVEAKNEDVNCMLNTEKGTIAFTALIKQFHFERSLMEEHFNENYLESNRYPKATFKGLIEKFDLISINTSPKDYQIKGKINIHGKSKNIRVIAKIRRVANNKIEIISTFALNTDDFNIDIPYIVRSKISKNVNITVKCVLQ